MRALISVWYTRERLAACSARCGINETIRTAIFSKYDYTTRLSPKEPVCHQIHASPFIVEFCLLKYDGFSADKLKRDLTSKCGEERRKLK